jgi:transketolase
MTYPLRDDIYNDDVQLEPTRAGYGRGLRAAGESNEAIVGLCADLTESTLLLLLAV